MYKTLLLFITLVVTQIVHSETPNPLPQKQSHVVLITGCSRGIGFVTARTLVKEGYTVYATMRDLSKSKYLMKEIEKFPGKLIVKILDVTNEDSIKQVIEEIVAKEGHIDSLVNNAGWGLQGTADGITIEQAKKMFDTNFFGMLRLIQATLPTMQKQSKGKIINISSLSALAPLPGWDLYAASKQAVETLSEAMLPTLNAWNIQISVIEPGPLKDPTNQTITAQFPKVTNPYSDILAASKKWLEAKTGPPQPVEEVAVLIHKIIETEKPQFRYQTNTAGKQLAEETLLFPTQSVLDLNNYISTQ